MGEYVSAELGVLDAQHRELLLASCVVGEICVPLATALTGDPKAGRTLHELAADNFFMVSGAGWFRHHQLVWQALGALLRTTDPELELEFRRRAASWYEGQGDGLEALRLAVETRDWDYVGQLALRSAVQLAFTAERGVLGGQLAQIPADAAAGRPELQVALAYGAFCQSDLAAASAHLRWAEQDLAELPQPRAAVATLALRLLQGLVAHRRGELAATQRFAVASENARKTLRTADAQGWARLPGLSMSLLAVTQLWAGHPEQAVDLMSWAMTHQGGVSSQGYLALTEGALGRLGRAFVEAQTALAEDGASWYWFSDSGPAWLALALAALQRNDLVLAGRAVERGELANGDQSPLIGAGLRLAATGRRLQAGELRAARQGLREADARLAGLPRVPWLAAMRTALGVELELAAGQPARAGALLAAHAELAGPAEEPFVAPARAQLLLATGRAGEVRAALGELPARTGTPGAHAWLLISLAEDALRRDASATEALAHALDAAVPEGFRQPFAKPTGRLAVLLRRHVDVVGSHREFVLSLLAETDAAAEGLALEQLPGIAEPLTERERSVLAYLPTLSSNLEIADALAISVNTVKQHLKSINRKLGVGSRREAVRKAARLGLLPAANN